MKKLIDQYPATPTSTERFTKRSCIEHLCSEKKLLTILMRVIETLYLVIKISRI